jgi:hypothetical protein
MTRRQRKKACNLCASLAPGEPRLNSCVILLECLFVNLRVACFRILRDRQCLSHQLRMPQHRSKSPFSLVHLNILPYLSRYSTCISRHHIRPLNILKSQCITRFPRFSTPSDRTPRLHMLYYQPLELLLCLHHGLSSLVLYVSIYFFCYTLPLHHLRFLNSRTCSVPRAYSY